VCGDEVGGVYVLDLCAIRLGPLVVAAKSATKSSLFKKVTSLAFNCPSCQVWTGITEADLGSEIVCPNCGKPIRLNRFSIQSDWRTIAGARKK
jgi:predicted RNA-binding Zn-ribbon protein involved in translation (DUF1610 family)